MGIKNKKYIFAILKGQITTKKIKLKTIVQINNWFFAWIKLTTLSMKNDNIWSFILKSFMKQIQLWNVKHKYILKTLI